jgi:tetratricopeptide (TPR) repeat protein
MCRSISAISMFLFGMLIHTAVAMASDFTREDVLQLPEYCQARVAGVLGVQVPASRVDRVQHWKNLFGHDFTMMNHYCYGLIYANRANRSRADRNKYKFDLERAADNFEYTFSHVSKQWYYMPQAYVDYGKVLEQLGRKPEAAQQYLQATILKPTYVRAYVALSMFYERQGNAAAAREVLEDGLKHAPDSRSLKRRLAKLDS